MCKNIHMEEKEKKGEGTPNPQEKTVTKEEKPKDEKNKIDDAKAKADEGGQKPKEKEPSYADALNKVKADYEKKIANLNEAHKKQIKERDDIIRQLAVNGDEKPQTPRKTVHEIINERRKIVKW